MGVEDLEIDARVIEKVRGIGQQDKIVGCQQYAHE
jgi:hypothetical protein